jgi:hypothetical protein
VSPNFDEGGEAFSEELREGEAEVRFIFILALFLGDRRPTRGEADAMRAKERRAFFPLFFPFFLDPSDLPIFVRETIFVS